MRKTLWLMLAALVSITIFTACEKEDTVSPSDNTYFSGAKDGSYWIYHNAHLDTSGVETSVNNLDSLWIVKDSTHADKKSHFMNHKFYNTITNTTNTAGYCMYESDNQVYISSDFMKLFIPSMFQGAVDYLITSSWYKLADGSAVKSWVLDSMQVDSMTIPAGDALGDISVTGVLKMEMSRDTGTFAEYGVCDKYSLIVSFSGSSPQVDAMLPIPGQHITFGVNFAQVDFYFAEGIGMVGIHSLPLPVEVVAFGGAIKYPIMNTEGFKKTLIRKNITK